MNAEHTFCQGCHIVRDIYLLIVKQCMSHWRITLAAQRQKNSLYKTESIFEQRLNVRSRQNEKHFLVSFIDSQMR